MRPFYLDDDDEEQEEERMERRIDKEIDAQMLKNRRVFLSTQVDQASANDVIRKLWYLESKDPGKPILFVINSPGGSVDCGLAIWDQIQMITSPVTTLVTGLAASMGSLLSLVGGKGKRFATPRSRFMIHQPAIHGVIRGQATDLEIQAKEILKTRNELISIYVDATGKDEKTVEKDLDRDTWLNAKEALAYGLIDEIVDNYKKIGF